MPLAVFCLSVCLSQSAATLGYGNAGCLQLSHVRTADPSADGRRSAASRTAIGGGISSRRRRGDTLLSCVAPATIDVKKRSNKNFKNLKNVKKRDKNKKTFLNVLKQRYLFLVQFNSTPDAQEIAFKATRNMAFSLVLQKLSWF